jgi:hypothetical protein
MSTTDPFVQRVKSILVPDLRAGGFVGRFPTFRRVQKELIHEVLVQGWRYGGERTVNLSFGFTFIQPEYADPAAPVMEYSYRIGAVNGRGRWWQYGSATEAEAMSLADEMISVFRAEAPEFFGRFKVFPGSFVHFTAKDFVDAPLSSLPPRIGGGRSVARDCWVFMRLWLHLGDQARARDFAKTGLEHVGKAKALESDFRAALRSL